MQPARFRVPFLIGVLLITLGSVACTQEPTPTPTQLAPTPTASIQAIKQTAETPAYQVTLVIGPVVTLLTSEGGEQVMGMMTGMTFTDRGQPVNHHLEVHVLDKSALSRVEDVIPIVRITDQATGTSQEVAANVHASGEVPYVLACMTTKHRETERHFGDNLYLPSGIYTVTVGVGDGIVSLENIVVEPAG